MQHKLPNRSEGISQAATRKPWSFFARLARTKAAGRTPIQFKQSLAVVTTGSEHAQNPGTLKYRDLYIMRSQSSFLCAHHRIGLQLVRWSCQSMCNHGEMFTHCSCYTGTSNKGCHSCTCLKDSKMVPAQKENWLLCSNCKTHMTGTSQSRYILLYFQLRLLRRREK